MTEEAGIQNKVNWLGDARAEFDHLMLDFAFHEWQDYKSLLNANDRFIVVGRRGTGKSALTYKLQQEWKEKKHIVIVVAPNEEELTGLRAAVQKYGDKLTRIRSAVKIGWRYTLIMEILLALSSHYKTQQLVFESSVYSQHVRPWEKSGASPLIRLKKMLYAHFNSADSQEENISELASRINLNTLNNEMCEILAKAGRGVVVLIDRLDEGYESDTLGVGIVDGIIYGTDEIRVAAKNVQTIIFLRDNIFRAIQIEDDDFSRNLEGGYLRLHWDPQELFYLVCKRLRQALKVRGADIKKFESDIKLWNSVTAQELHGREGFRRCLQITLYRPRDVISLLNAAFDIAKKQDRQVIILSDIDAASRFISSVRYDDLAKEYSSVFPGLRELTKAFSQLTPRVDIGQARDIVAQFSETERLEPQIVQHLRVLGTSDEIIKALYGIGFFGVLDSSTNSFVFSHDGKRPHQLFHEKSVLLIHPCYWNALNVQTEAMEPGTAEDIYDEYEIVVSSQTKELREQKLGRLITEINGIEMGPEGATAFEDWCKHSLELIFAGELSNVTLKPNGNGSARRDIVATNEAIKGFWKRIRDDYGTRMVVFEMKNFEKLTIEEYRQAHSYLGKEYGKFAIIICRDKMKELSKDAEMGAFMEFYHKDAVILKVTASAIVQALSKIRSPQKFDAAGEMFSRHLDTHITMYANGQKPKGKKTKA
ncbi:P-loop ATPase, Sll1717 family [Collimonas fungivorans]|uniref:P-loop ATPase, Sll1717 family n=1 Tax=Collimonas fungivorans TaxID=158899 RepID=UPI003FA3A9C2